MSEWQYLTLDKMGSISRGKSKHRPRNDPRLYGGQYPFVQTGDIKAAGLYLASYSQTYNETGLAQSKLWPADTLCITIAANIADTAILAFPACFPDSVMGFIPDRDICLVRYVKYCFDILQAKCRQISQGTAQDNLSWERLSTIKFPVPSLGVQEQIVDVLSRYDELIENNRKQIKLLEEAAQRLYKEWFVDLKFPGHEAASINPETNLPEGWRVLSAADVFPITIGKTPSRKDSSAFSNEGIPWASVSDMGKEGSIILSTSERLTQEGINSYKVKTVPEGSVLLSFKLTVGRVSIAGCTMASNEAIAHFVTDNNALRNYCFLYLKDFDFSKLGSTSSIGTAINSKIVKALPFVLPDETTLKSFDDVTSSIIELIISNKRQIALLQEARDRMLPKLMSGEIEVG